MEVEGRREVITRRGGVSTRREGGGHSPHFTHFTPLTSLTEAWAPGVSQHSHSGPTYHV
jgi:hypothetical protein